MVFLWNLIATVLFLACLRLSWVTLGADWLALPFIALFLIVLAVLRWTFIQKRYARLHTALLWAYLGVFFGVLGGLVEQFQSLWKFGLAGITTFLVFMLMPSTINEHYWNAQLRKRKPVAWNARREQNREEVLRDSPFRIERVTQVTEETSGGVVQDSVKRSDSFEAWLNDVQADSETTLTALEEWILARYRAYRKSQNLPVSVTVAETSTVTREEREEIEPFTTPAWEGSGPLSAPQVLLTAPYLVTWDTAEGMAALRFTLAGTAEPDALTQEERQLPVLSTWQPTLGSVEQFSVRVAATGRVVARFSSVEEAQAEILRRYADQRTLNGREPGAPLQVPQANRVLDPLDAEDSERILN